ncbi:MAG: 4Fe-4S dicluster domain-containing protein [Myxococcota bacterium]
MADVDRAAGRPARRPRRRRRRLSRVQERRRRFLRAGLATIGLLCLQPLAFLPLVRRWRDRLRPPGALDERAFLGACIKCGQCVQVCPVEAIALADMNEGLGTGAPFIDPRRQACDFSCDALSCILACPTGALSHSLAAKEEVEAGLARLVRPERCLARNGEAIRGLARGPEFPGRLRYVDVDRWNPIPVRRHPYDRDPCDLCVLECPIGDTAIAMVPFEREDGRWTTTPEVRAGCVGCGVCEMICPPDPPVIEIVPRSVLQTEIGTEEA